MSAAERRKGARGQLAVRQLFEAHGWDVTATASTRRKGSNGARAAGSAPAVDAPRRPGIATPGRDSRPYSSGTCDLLASRAGVTLAIEVKNQAVLRLPLWRRQTLANAPEGTVPVLVYRHRGEWVTEYVRP